MKPRATAPQRRLQACTSQQQQVSSRSNVRTSHPHPNKHEMEAILEAAAKAGAESAGYVMLRLPLEVANLFQDWLHHHYPDRAKGILRLIRELHGGALYQSNFGTRMQGSGTLAKLTKARFRTTCKRLGLQRRLGLGPSRDTEQPTLRTDLFTPPHTQKAQLTLL